MSISFGRAMSARPMATICCSPPESVPGELAPALVQEREERVHAFVVLGIAAAVEVGAHLEVLEDGHRAEQPPVLGDDRHSLANAVARRPPRDILAGERDRARARADDPEHRLQRGGLPGRVAAEQADELARADRQVRVLEDVHLPVVGVDAREAEERLRPVGRVAHFRSVADVPRYASTTLGLVATSSYVPSAIFSP